MLDEPVPTPEPPPPEQPTLIGGLSPDEMFARGMQSVKMTSGTQGTWQPPSVEEANRLFPNYAVLGLLGRGGMGAVYKANQTSLDRLVAIKLLPLEVSVDKDFADRFVREARAMAKLNHPNIISVHDFGKTSEGHLYFVMEYVEGANLADLIHRVGLTSEQSLAIVEQVCTALAYAHAKGIVHRDIKPANVMIDTESQVKVADFGLARLTDPTAEQYGHTMTGTVMGTPDYMAPEQMKGMNVDHRADIYSLGVMVYEMLCREVPRGAFEPPSVHTGCDPRIDPIVIKAMQPNPDRRYQSTQEMKADVSAVRTPLLVAPPAPQAAVAPLPKPPRIPAKPTAPPTPETAVMQAIPLPKPTKSKTPLYVGIAAAVAILAAAAFLVPKLRDGGGDSRGLEDGRAQLGHALGPGSSASHPPLEAGASPTEASPSRSLGTRDQKVGAGSPVSQPPLVPSATSDGASPSAATKDTPFVNTLGMKFVPVPGTKVLFSIWDTRVQDYAAYAAAKKVDDSWTKQAKDGVPVGRELNHPVVGVSWEDAQAFCQWLTEKEIAEGKLPKGLKYRLPTDEEWSLAVGLPPELGTTPAEKSDKNSVDFPWGKEWPPKGKMGNYADETYHAKFPLNENGKDDWDKNHWIEGYTDGYATTSPVGSFPANGYGLYDMGGNVFQWCEDWYDAAHKDRVSRGASWNAYDRGNLLSSYRNHHVPAHRTHPYGFRCVVGASGPPAAGAVETSRAGEFSSSPGYPQPEHWVDVTESVRARGLQAGRLVADEGWLTLGKDKSWYSGQCLAENGASGIAVRAVFRKAAEITFQTSGRTYFGHMGGHASIGYIDQEKKKLIDLKGDVAPGAGYVVDAEHELVFAALEDRLKLWVDGREIVNVQAGPLSVSEADIAWLFGDVRVKKVEYAKLADAPARSGFESATKDAPFVNTLGMKFVPVPGTKVLFSVWDTRVQDYAAYSGAKKVDDAWAKQQKDGVPVGREVNHPVAGVNWDDAQAFCQWLTEKEIAEGKLPKGMKYRLPTDEEWSWAVGLPPESGTTPAEKSAKNSVDFPWGKDYPPKDKMGNYPDESFHAQFPSIKNEKENRMENQWMEGYTDGYATTSPVGAFPANAYGLYDMGGNVWQWCEDWFDASHKERVQRGASWGTANRGALLSSYRSHLASTYHSYFNGFRCVLSESAPPATTAPTPTSESSARKAAEWALGLGGSLYIRSAGRGVAVAKLADLPTGLFEILSVDFLDASKAQQEQVTDAGLALLAGLRNIETLKLNNSPVTDEGLSVLENFPNLNLLSLDGCQAVTNGTLLHLKNAARLQSLYVGKTSVNTAGLLGLREFRNLRSLGVASSPLPSEACAAIGELQGLTRLIAYHSPQLSSDILAHLKKLPNLTDLQLSNGAPLTDADMVDIAGFTQLTTLWLPRGVGDATLAQVPKLPNLTELQIGTGGITDAGLASLKSMKKLTSLTISSKAAVTEAGIADLQKALPNLKIVRDDR